MEKCGLIIVLSVLILLPPTCLVAQVLDEAFCGFEKYRAIKIGIPIRGGHDQLAVSTVAPTYPPGAMESRGFAAITVHAIIDREGNVVDTCASGPKRFADSATDAVSKWKFKKNFGFGTRGTSSEAPRYARIVLRVDFIPPSHGKELLSAPARDEDLGVCSESCNQKSTVRISAGMLLRRATEKVKLQFPMLHASTLRGEVVLAVVVDELGSVVCAQAVSGHPIAVSAAMDAIPKWRFRPFVQRGERRPMCGRIVLPYDARR